MSTTPPSSESSSPQARNNISHQDLSVDSPTVDHALVEQFRQEAISLVNSGLLDASDLEGLSVRLLDYRDPSGEAQPHDRIADFALEPNFARLEASASEPITSSHYMPGEHAMTINGAEAEYLTFGGPGAYATGRFGATKSRQRVSLMGRKSQFAASGTSRWRGLVAERLNPPQALAPTTVRFRGTPDIRPGGQPRSGIGIS